MKVKDTKKKIHHKENGEEKKSEKRMNRHCILFCKTTSLIHQDGGNISSPVCFCVLSGLVMDEGPGDTHLHFSSTTAS